VGDSDIPEEPDPDSLDLVTLLSPISAAADPSQLVASLTDVHKYLTEDFPIEATPVDLQFYADFAI
jgi:hypothetical protein